MKFAHIVAIVVFVITLLLSGGSLAKGVQTGAACGFWISLILGSLITLLLLAFFIIGIVGVGEMGRRASGIPSAFFGSLGAGVIIAIISVFAIASVALAVLGYDALRDWGASNLENKNALIKACVFLGLSIVLSLLQSSGKRG